MCQAQREFVFMLRIDNVNTLEPQEHLTILKRGALSQGILDEKLVDYIDYVPSFQRVTGDRCWQNVIELNEPFDYSAQYKGSYYDEHANQVLCEWLFPRLSICIRKPLHEKIFVLDRFSPQIRQKDVGLFLVYPEEQGGKYPGIRCD